MFNDKYCYPIGSCYYKWLEVNYEWILGFISLKVFKLDFKNTTYKTNFVFNNTSIDNGHKLHGNAWNMFGHNLLGVFKVSSTWVKLNQPN
jgi:hypothetical protein